MQMDRVYNNHKVWRVQYGRWQSIREYTWKEACSMAKRVSVDGCPVWVIQSVTGAIHREYRFGQEIPID